MLVSFLVGLFVFLCLILGALILIQQGKGDMGMGGLHRGTQALFGGSGGQTFFEKLTWALGAIFIFGALSLTVLKMREQNTSRIAVHKSAPVMPHNK